MRRQQPNKPRPYSSNSSRSSPRRTRNRTRTRMLAIGNRYTCARCARCSGGLLPPSPPAEKAAACEDQARQASAEDGPGHDQPLIWWRGNSKYLKIAAKLESGVWRKMFAVFNSNIIGNTNYEISLKLYCRNAILKIFEKYLIQSTCALPCTLLERFIIEQVASFNNGLQAPKKLKE